MKESLKPSSEAAQWLESIKVDIDAVVDSVRSDGFSLDDFVILAVRRRSGQTTIDALFRDTIESLEKSGAVKIVSDYMNKQPANGSVRVAAFFDTDQFYTLRLMKN